MPDAHDCGGSFDRSDDRPEGDRMRVGDRAEVNGRHSTRCTSTSSRDGSWWLCDRLEDHSGDHASISLSGIVLATWTEGDFDALLR